MCRKKFLKDISNILEKIGFIPSNTKAPFTYQSNIKYPSIFTDKSDHAHFILYTPKRTLQVVVKYQESTGTTIEKLGYTALDAARTKFDNYIVVCGGCELLKHSRAIKFLNEQKDIAPKLHALRIEDLIDFINDDLPSIAA